MFTGIVEAVGIVHSIETKGTNVTFCVSSPISGEFKVDQSISHSGVCLTVEGVNDNIHSVTAIEETLLKTNLSDWKEGALINLERCMQINGRLDGHIVQGHVDTTGECIDKKDLNGSYDYTFSFPPKFAALVIEKGSICLNGMSLTIYNVTNTAFTVSIIPYTFEHTNICKVKKGDKVNIEFDMIGKYINRISSLKQS